MSLLQNFALELFGTFVSLAALVGGIWWHLHQRIMSNRLDLERYKLHVAEKYASSSNLKHIEDRLVVEMRRISDRLDRLLSSIDSKNNH